MIKSILLPIDGSVYTEAQVRYTVELARAFDARVSVLSILDVRIFEWAVVMGTDGFVPIIPSNVYKEESKKILESKAAAVLEKCSEILTSENVEFDAEKISGSPSDIICEKAPLVDLLVIGMRGEFAKWKKNLVGATLDAVMRQWSKSILVTSREFKSIGNILFAYDGSERSNKALQLVGLFATQLSAPVTVLSVHDKEIFRSKLLEEAQSYLKPYKAQVDLVGVSGNPEKEIIRVAGERHCDLMIMGAFGHSRIREAILGSTTEQVVRKADVPVLLSK
ncbi:MAG: universal stress protein [Calditrichaeota bacterium]|nr:universal stress protein [Calditrichota bacterium]